MDTKKWINQLDAITRDFREQFAGLNQEELNRKPSPTIWSVAQNIDHLMVINKTYYPVIDAVRKGTYELPWIARFPFMVRFFGKVILDSVSADRRKRMRTFPLWEPSKSEIAGDVLTRFEQHQADLKEVIANAAELLDRKTIISSPANRNIVYYLETLFDIIVEHERRHLAQAREARDQTAG